jgi:hypothetical protein
VAESCVAYQGSGVRAQGSGVGDQGSGLHSFLCTFAHFSVHTAGVVSTQFSLPRPPTLIHHPPFYGCSFSIMSDAPPSWVFLAFIFFV